MKKKLITCFLISALSLAFSASVSAAQQDPSDADQTLVFTEIEDPVLLPEEHLSLSEALDALPDSLEAVDIASGEAVFLPVDWECLDNYNDPTLASFVFQAVPAEEGIVLKEELPRMEIYYPEEGWVTSHSSSGLATSVQTLSDETLQGETAPEEELCEASYASLDRSFWDNLDYDEGFQYTKQQETFLNRIQAVLEKYLYENTEPEVVKDSYTLTETISFADLGNLYYDTNNRFAEDPNCVTSLVNSFQKAHPQYFFATTAYSCSAKGRFLRCVIMPNFADPADRNAAAVNMKQNMDSILKSADKDTEKETARYLHDAVCNWVTYDYSAKTSGYVPGCEMYEQSLASAFFDAPDPSDASKLNPKNRYTICAGYSQAYAALCNYVHIPAFSVTSKDHQWNKILIDGFYYTVDTTWDDGSTISTNYFLREELDQINMHQPQAQWASILKSHQYSLGRYGFLQVNYTVAEKNARIGKGKTYTEIIPKGGSFQPLGSAGKETPAVTLSGYALDLWKAADDSLYRLNETYPNAGTETKRLYLTAEWLPTKAPSLSVKTIVLNLMAEAPSAELELTPPEGTILSAVTLNTENAKLASYALTPLGDGRYRISLTKNSTTHTGKDSLFLEGSYYVHADGASTSFTLPLTASLVNQAPTVTLKALSPANLFLKEAKAIYQITSTIPLVSVSLHEENTGSFTVDSFDPDTGILSLKALEHPTGKMDAKARKVRLLFKPQGFDAIEKTLSVSVTNRTPVSLSLKNVSLTPGTTRFTGLFTDKTTKQPYEPSPEETVSVQVQGTDLIELGDFDHGYFSGTYLGTDLKSVRAKLYLDSSAWVNTLSFSFTVKPNQKAPSKLTLGSSKAALLSSASVSVPVSLGGSNAVIENLRLQPAGKDSFSVSYADHLNETMSWNSENLGYIDALLHGDPSLGTGKARVFFQAEVAGKTVKSSILTLTVLDHPSMKIKVSGNLKASDPYSRITLTPKLDALPDARIEALTLTDPRFRILKEEGYYFLMGNDTLTKEKVKNLVITGDISLYTGEDASAETAISFSVN